MHANGRATRMSACGQRPSLHGQDARGTRVLSFANEDFEDMDHDRAVLPAGGGTLFLAVAGALPHSGVASHCRRVRCVEAGALARVIIKPRPICPRTSSRSPVPRRAPPTSRCRLRFLTGDYAGKNWPVRDDVQQILHEPPESISLQDYGCGMNHFYAALALTEQKEAGGHHAHQPLRRLAHQRRPDFRRSAHAAPGKVRRFGPRIYPDRQALGLLLSRGRLHGGRGWKVSSPVLPGGGGGSLGLGGASFTAGSSSAYSGIHTTKKGEGSAVSRFDIYLSRPTPRRLLSCLCR